MSMTKRKRRIFTKEFKKQVVQLYLNGKSKFKYIELIENNGTRE